MFSFGIASTEDFGAGRRLTCTSSQQKSPGFAVRRSQGKREYQSGYCDPTPAEVPRHAIRSNLHAALSSLDVRRDRRLDFASGRPCHSALPAATTCFSGSRSSGAVKTPLFAFLARCARPVPRCFSRRMARCQARRALPGPACRSRRAQAQGGRKCTPWDRRQRRSGGRRRRSGATSKPAGSLLSATRTEGGSYTIDPAELHRVFHVARDGHGHVERSVTPNGLAPAPAPESVTLRQLLAERDRLVEEQASAIRDLRQRFDDSEGERRRVQERLTAPLTHRQAGSVPAVAPRLSACAARGGDGGSGDFTVAVARSSGVGGRGRAGGGGP